MNKKQKFRVGFIFISFLILMAFLTMNSSLNKIFAKTTTTISMTENEIHTNELFHVKISDTGNEKSTSDSTESKKSWQLSLPEGIIFDESEEREFLLDKNPTGELPTFYWNKEQRLLTITVAKDKTDLTVLLKAEQSGKYTIALSDEDKTFERQELNLTVTDNSTPAAESTSVQSRSINSFSTAGTAEVTDWKTFVEALADNTVTTISLQNDIILSGTLSNYSGLFSTSSADLTSAQNVYLYISKNATARGLTIDGNGHNFDFGNLAIGFLNQSSYVSGNSGSVFGYWNLKFQNINVASSNYSGPFYISSYTASENVSNGLTGTMRTNAAISYDSSTTKNIRNVQDFLGYTIGINDPWVTNVELKNDIYVTAPTYTSNYYIYSPYAGVSQNVTTGTSVGVASGGVSYLYFGVQGNARKVVINGNNYTVDFASICFTFTGDNNAGGKAWNIEYSNMTVYHGNYWGPMIFNNGSYGGSMTMNNYTGYGTQFLESQSTNLTLKNKVHLEQQKTWTSKRKDGTTIRTWTVNDFTQGSVAIANTTVEDNANVYISSLGSNVLYMPSGSFTIGKNVQLTLERGNEVNASEYYNTNLNISGGMLSVGEGSTVDILNHRSTYGGAVFLGSSTSQLNIAKNATVNITTDAYTGTGEGDINYNPVYMNGGSINVAGHLNIKGTNMQTSTTSLFYVANNSTFIVQKGGSFDIQSDSTSNSQYLLRMGGAASTFQFSDAERVNLQKTKLMTNATSTNNGLIWSQGNLDVSVQNVYQWKLNNISTGTDGESGYDFAYVPMSGMRLAYNSSYNPTITKSNAMTNATLALFNANFTTLGQQRILFTQVLGPNISIKSVATDNHTDTSSTVITGYARPDTYVRLWDVPANSKVTAALDPTKDSVKSPVEDTSTPAEYRANFTTKADASGNWSVTVPTGKYLSAGSVIHAYGFTNLKAEEVTQTVLDKTPPTASPVTYYITKGDSLPSASVFVTNATDSSPINTGIDYSFTDPAAAATAAATVGTHTVQVNVSDRAVDATGNPAPNTTVVDATLVVYDQAAAITASDFNAPYVDIRNLSTEDLKNYIIKNTQPSAYKLVNGKKTDLSQYVTVSSFGGLDNMSAIQPIAYTVTLTVKAADSGLATDISKTIQVTVVDVDSIVTVEFLNEANQVLPGYTVTINSQVGNTIDLTADKNVVTQLTNVVNAGYEIAERPSNETAVKVDNTALTVKYKLQGVLSLTSVPTMLDFGTLSYDATTKRVENPSFDEQLIVTDTRVDAENGWQLTASLSTAMHNKSGQELVNALRYVNQGKETILNTDSQVIYTNTKGVPGSYTVSENWGKVADTDGIKLQIDSANVVYTGDYTGVITWKVMAGQP